MTQNNYNIKLNNFEGPMDLLLYFINRDRINIYDIPILKITEDYLNYIKIMEMMDIDMGSEFIYMSSVLLQIKARMLIPSIMDIENEEFEDPRAELVFKLLEYKRFKDASDQIERKYDEHKKRFSRGMNLSYSPSNNAEYIVPSNISIYDLAISFKNIIDSLPENNELDIYADEIQLEDHINHIKGILNDKSKFKISSCIDSTMSRSYVVGFFLALLELLNTRYINFKQIINFSDIVIYKV